MRYMSRSIMEIGGDNKYTARKRKKASGPVTYELRIFANTIDMDKLSTYISIVKKENTYSSVLK